MSSSRLANIAAGLVFLAIAAVALYRLLFYFPITIGGVYVGQVASFFAFVVCAALALILFVGRREPR